jgi:RNA polymerase primary sigma factor
MEEANADDDKTKLPNLIDSLINKYTTQASQGRESFDMLVLSNLRFAIYVVGKIKNSGMSMSELISYAHEALMFSASRYDPRKGFKFTTYASKMITFMILTGINRERHLIPLPQKVERDLGSARQEFFQFLQTNGKKPKNKLPPALVAALQTRGITYLDKPIADDFEETLETSIADTNTDVLNEVIQLMLKAGVEEMLSTLSEKERQILEMRFGINGKTEMTLEEIGTVFALSRERIRQIENIALEKLRNTPAARSMLDFI